MMETYLPWSGESVLKVANAREQLVFALGSDERYLPRTIELFVELPVLGRDVADFWPALRSTWLGKWSPAIPAAAESCGRPISNPMNSSSFSQLKNTNRNGRCSIPNGAACPFPIGTALAALFRAPACATMVWLGGARATSLKPGC